MQIVVRLSQTQDHTNTMDLQFDLESHHFVDKWIERYKFSQQRGDPISEPWAFYNLNDYWSNEQILKEMRRLVNECNRIRPGTFNRHLNRIDDQDTLNYLHSVFELHHGQLDTWQSNPVFNIPDGNQLRKNLSLINQLVHRTENASRSNGRRIRVVWFDTPKTKTYTTDDYKLFTNRYDFGGVYICYPDVGKNLESFATDDDDHVHDFVPNLHYSADVFLDFRNTMTEEEAQAREQQYRDYYFANQEYFEGEGYYWGDPKLTTGRIKIAQLNTDLSKDQLLEQISNYNHIQGLYLI